MREILFKGKRHNGDWVEGNLFVPDNPNTPTEICIGTNIVRITYDVIPETVGQYTGLTDKYGTKIFEGDIIKQTYSLNGKDRDIISVIEYGTELLYHRTCGVCQRFRDGSGTAILTVSESGNVFCEVIGNIHDNLKLLKGGDE